MSISVAIGIAAVLLIGVFLWLQERSTRRLVAKRMQAREAYSVDEFGRHFFTETTAPIALRLREILARHIQVDLSKLHPDDRFIEDLEMVELDSLSTVNFAVDVEREFGITIPDADAARLRTFGDVVEYVSGAVRRAAV
jgi:acyl carrier protein